jgi:peptidoglycan/xylan/chitin deacetylase (PgdA/CDA1 family)
MRLAFALAVASLLAAAPAAAEVDSREAMIAPGTQRTTPTSDPLSVPVPVPVAVPRPSILETPARRVAGERGVAACNNPGGLGTARTVTINPAGGPGYGSQQYKDNDFLAEGEIVLTFDDGPMPAYTKPIIEALEQHCSKATFFMVGRMALTYPELVKDIARRGHTIGTHTFTHANLGVRKMPKPQPGAPPSGSGLFGSNLQSGWMSYGGIQASVPRVGSSPGTGAPKPGSTGLDSGEKQQWITLPPMSAEKAQREIELGFSAVSRALGRPVAPFFRFPYLGHTQANLRYLGTRDMAVFSIDVDSVDYRARSSEEVISKTLKDLAYFKKGILLFHDIQAVTAQAIPRLLVELKQRGYRVVHLKPEGQLATIASMDAAVESEHRKRKDETAEKPLVQRTMTWPLQKPVPTAPAAQRPQRDNPWPSSGGWGWEPPSTRRSY